MIEPISFQVRNTWYAVAAIPALLLFSSCASVEAPRSANDAIPLPEGWQQRPEIVGNLDAASLMKWWEKFDDPVLNELVAGALQSNTDARTGIARIEEARARRGVEKGYLFPSLTAGASGREGSTHLRGTSLTTRSQSYGTSLDAAWEADLFGRQKEYLRAASADLAAAEENYRDVQVSVVAEVAVAYVALREAEAQLLVVERRLSAQKETVQITQWREQAGTGSALDTQQSISTFEQARATIPSLQQTISQNRNQLSLLTGKTPGVLNSLLVETGKIPVAPTGVAIGIPAETLRQRPDVRAAERSVEASGARTAAAKRQRLPSLTLNGSVGVEALTLGHFFSPETSVMSAIGNLTAPIFNAGRIRQTVAIQNAVETQFLIAYESTVLTALSDVENALVFVQRSAERQAILNLATNAARDAAAIADQRYKAGQIDLLVVLEAQRILLSLEEQDVSTAADQAKAHIQLYKALGGGWSRP